MYSLRSRARGEAAQDLTGARSIMGHDQPEMPARDAGGDILPHNSRGVRSIVTIRPLIADIRGKKHIIAGSLWMPVPDWVTFDDIDKFVEYRSPSHYSEPATMTRHTVPSAGFIEEPVTRYVTGSKGDTYAVTTYAGKTTCTCDGFKYRGSCKHS